MRAQVIALTGRRGAGKTAIGQALAVQLGWRFASFGDYIRSVARTRGRPESDVVLQDLGATFVERDPQGLVAGVLDTVSWKPGEPVVVDGIRHERILRLLEERVAPLPVVLVYVDVPEEQRLERLRQRGEPTDRDVEEHSTEEEVRTVLPKLAAFTVTGVGASTAAAGAIIDRLGRS
jgi:dephospho-CoA kinase